MTVDVQMLYQNTLNLIATIRAAGFAEGTPEHTLMLDLQADVDRYEKNMEIVAIQVEPNLPSIRSALVKARDSVQCCIERLQDVEEEIANARREGSDD